MMLGANRQSAVHVDLKTQLLLLSDMKTTSATTFIRQNGRKPERTTARQSWHLDRSGIPPDPLVGLRGRGILKKGQSNDWLGDDKINQRRWQKRV